MSIKILLIVAILCTMLLIAVQYNNYGEYSEHLISIEQATNPDVVSDTKSISCSIGSGGSNSCQSCKSSTLYPIMDPMFNMREVSKQCLLLEDHLNTEKKRCYDCIRKHMLIIDGLLEEAVGLEHSQEKRAEYRKLHMEWINIEKMFSKNPSDPSNIDEVSKHIRSFRKPLVEKYFDIIKDYHSD